MSLAGLAFDHKPDAVIQAARVLFRRGATEHRYRSGVALWARLDGGMMEKRGDTIIETAQEARQAERGPTVRNVLVWSTSMVIVAFAIVWYVFFRT